MDITTTLSTAMKRALSATIHDIAREGLIALKEVLDNAGFSESQYLKNYEVFSHVVRDEIVFEILLDVEAVVPADTTTSQQIQTQSKNIEDSATKTFGISSKNPREAVDITSARRDARRPARDVRRPARDARKNSRDRLIEKEILNVSPRSARIQRDGRLAVALRRSITDTGKTTEFPSGVFQGILGKFIGELKSILTSKFLPIMTEIVQKYV